ncbi:MAG: hypothetical protein ACRDP6_15785 [Actinoallomurus sp.]
MTDVRLVSGTSNPRLAHDVAAVRLGAPLSPYPGFSRGLPGL